MVALGQIGFHMVGGFSQAEVNNYFGLLNDTRPACINVLGASQYREALDFAKRAKEHFPEMRIIFRHYVDGSDNGIWTRISAADWWERIGKLYIGTGLTILSDNESTMADYTPYAAWQAEVLQRAGDEGVAIAYGRFPTHHPERDKYPQLATMFVAANRYHGLHTYSPNIYFSSGNLDGFNIFNYTRLRIKTDGTLINPINITIGEFALLRDIRDAHNGWRSVDGVDGESYANRLTTLAKGELPNIPVCIYSIGKWPLDHDTFSLDKAALDTIKANLIPIQPTPPTPDPPAPPTDSPYAAAIREIDLTIDKLEALAPVFRKAADDMQVALLSAQLAKDELEKLR